MVEIKVRKKNNDGVVRLESSGEVKEVLVNEDFLHPDHESIAVCFAGKDSSGILSFSPKEIDIIMRAVRERNHLIKGVKVFREKR